MADVQTGLMIHLAETGDAQSAFLNGYLRIYNASYVTLLSEHLISAAAGGADGTVDLTIDAATVEAGVSAQDAVAARIYASNGSTMLIGAMTAGVGSGDIRFDDNTGWNADDNVAPGAITVDLTSLTVTFTPA
jgi:flagellar hook assembly protein FlgD